MWSAAVLEPALPGRSSTDSGSPVPVGPWSTKLHSGWWPNPFLNVGAAPSLSVCAVTSVASTSTVSGAPASMRWSGACAPASSHARARAAARAVLIARNAATGSWASRSIARDTVGSEATGPNTPGSARSTAMSARQSPPNASVTARSSTIFAGSWRAFECRLLASAADSCLSSPTVRMVSVSSSPPACDTIFEPAVSTPGLG
jgi:hypothetical protein